MYEVEVKVAAEHHAVADRLDALDADELGVVTQEDTYYDAPHRDFAATDEALRVRRERDAGGQGTVLTYKGPKIDPDSKTREEVETGVEDATEMDDILQSLGFEPVAVVAKDRRRFRLEGYTVTLDSVEGLGEYVEIETESEDVDAARNGAMALLEDLGLDPGEQIRTSYLGLLLGDAEQ